MACLVQQCTLPPQSETIVPLYIKGPTINNHDLCLLEPTVPKINQKYITARALINNTQR